MASFTIDVGGFSLSALSRPQLIVYKWVVMQMDCKSHALAMFSDLFFSHSQKDD